MSEKTQTATVQEQVSQALNKLQNVPISRIVGYVILTILTGFGILIWQDLLYFALLFLTWKIVDKLWVLAFPIPE